MGEQKEGAVVTKAAEGEKKPEEAVAGKKDGGGDGGSITAVYEIDFHCEGCAKKVKRAIKNYEGVESMKTDYPARKLTVNGKFDPLKVKERLEDKIKRKVVLVSPQIKKPADDKKTDEKKKDDDGDKKPSPPKESTIVLKILLHCDGCIHKIKRIVSKFKGVNTVTVDAGKDLVTVKGTMDPKALVPYLKEKLKRNVEVVPAKKDDDVKKDAGAGDKKEKAVEGGGGGGGDKKKSGGEDTKVAGGDGANKKEGGDVKASGGDKKEGGGGGDAKAAADGGKKDDAGGSKAVEVVNKLDHYGYSYQSEPSYWFDDGHVYGQNHSMVGQYHYEYNPPQENVHQAYMNHNTYAVDHHAPSMYAVDHHAPSMYAVDHHAPSMYAVGHHAPDTYAVVGHHAPEMFSDENPHACSVM
jgi:copper chaperone CopZ